MLKDQESNFPWRWMYFNCKDNGPHKIAWCTICYLAMFFSRLNYMRQSKLFYFIKDVPSRKGEGGPHIKNGGQAMLLRLTKTQGLPLNSLGKLNIFWDWTRLCARDQLFSRTVLGAFSDIPGSLLLWELEEQLCWNAPSCHIPSTSLYSWPWSHII
jgi:hypothetical protein